MTKYTRLTGKVFGSSATATGDDPEIGQFGSALAGTYNGTTDVATIQNLPAWQKGFIGCVTPNTQFPPLPEMTGFGKVLSQQICYLLQQGIAEWDSGTTYYENNWCAYQGKLYISKSDENLNNLPTNTVYWTQFTGGSSRELGEVVRSSLPITNPIYHLADGSQLSSENYPEFLSYVAEIHDSYLNRDFSPAVQSATLGTGWNAICSENGVFIAIGDNKVSTSINGIVWTTPQTVSFKGISIAYGNGMFLATGTEEVEGLEAYGVYSSQNGINWQKLSVDAPGSFYGVGEIIFKGTYFYGIDHQTGELWESIDGIVWSQHIMYSPFQTIEQCKMATNNSTTIVLGYYQQYNGTYCHVSTNNLVTWTSTTPDELQGYQWSAITYDGNNFIAVSTNGYVTTSADGATWTTPTLSTNLGNNNWTDSTYGNSMVVVISKTGYISTKEAMPKLFTTEAEWQSAYATYGECGKYVYNAQANTVRIPLYNSYFTNTVNIDKLGDLTPASIPNITGSFGGAESYNEPQWNTGAFYATDQNTTDGGSTTKDADLTHFDASLVSDVYSDTATTVNTQSTKQLVYIVVAK